MARVASSDTSPALLVLNPSSISLHLQIHCGGYSMAYPMSSRRSRSRMTEEQISELLLKLQAVLPEARPGSSNERVMPAAKVLQEACSYIRSLHREVDDLSERLSDLLATADISGAQEAVIRSFLM